MKNILVARDTADAQKQATELISAMGHNVCAVASTTTDTLNAARSLLPDLVLLEALLPGGLNGPQTCNILQNDLGIPVVLIEHDGQEKAVPSAPPASPYGVIVEPCPPKQLQATVDAVLNLVENHSPLPAMIRQQIPIGCQADLLASVMESGQFGFALADSDGRLFYINHTFSKITGYTLNDFDQMVSLVSTILPDLPPMLSALLPAETQLITAAGEVLEVEAQYTRLLNCTSMLVITDLSQLTTTRRALDKHQQNESLKRKIADIFLTNDDKDVYEQVSVLLQEAYNAEFACFGYVNTSGELVVPPPPPHTPTSSNTHPRLVTPEDWGSPWGQCMLDQKIQFIDTPSNLPCGHPPVQNAVAIPIIQRGASIGQILIANRPEGFSAEVIDSLRHITDYLAPVLAARQERERLRQRRNNIEFALMESEAMYRRIVETSLEGIWTIDSDGLTTYVNNNLANMLGYEPIDMIGSHIFEFMDANAVALYERRLEKARQGFSAQFDFRYKHVNGQGIWTICSISPLTDRNGNYQGTLIMTSDITHRKFAEKSLLESEERFRQLVENLSEAFFIRDIKTGAGLYASPSYEYIWGLNIEEFYTNEEDFLKAVHPDDIGFVAERYHAFRNNPVSFSMDHRIVKKGQVRWIRTRIAPIHVKGKVERLAGISEDITESKNATRERDRLARAIEHVSEIVIITDHLGTVQYVNPAFERLSGISRSSISGASITALEAAATPSQTIQDMLATVHQGKLWTGHYRYSQIKGRQLTINATVTPIHDTSGKISNYVSVQRDITEEQQLETQLNQSRKMEALGTLAGGIAHDFNNILMAIIGFNELAIKQAEQDSRQRSHLERVAQAGARARDLVQQILTFSRRNEFELRTLDIIPLINESIKLLGATLPANISIVQDFQCDKAQVMADSGQIQQIIMNLCTNGAQALPHQGGSIRITIDRIELSQQVTAAHPSLKPGPYIEIGVGDTGIGMSPEVQQKIFDPFFTTKLPGEGTGMGLSVVHGTVRQLGGDIFVRSSEGVGTLITIYLPQADNSQRPNAVRTSSRPGKGEHILFIDDEEAISSLVENGLAELGYQVTSFTSPLEAVKAFEKSPEAFDAVISDIAMPQMDGGELARSLIRIRPEIPILLCTGNAESLGPNSDLLPKQRILVKPISIEDMSSAIREALDTEQSHMRKQ